MTGAQAASTALPPLVAVIHSSASSSPPHNSFPDVASRYAPVSCYYCWAQPTNPSSSLDLCPPYSQFHFPRPYSYSHPYSSYPGEKNAVPVMPSSSSRMNRQPHSRSPLPYPPYSPSHCPSLAYYHSHCSPPKPPTPPSSSFPAPHATPSVPPHPASSPPPSCHPTV